MSDVALVQKSSSSNLIWRLSSKIGMRATMIQQALLGMHSHVGGWDVKKFSKSIALSQVALIICPTVGNA